MRSHGVPNFPDPILFKGHLVFGFTAKSGVDPHTARFKAAYSYCGDRFLGLGYWTSPAETAKLDAQALKYSHCIRSHGLDSFPDPDGKGEIHLANPELLDTSVGQRAQKACKPLLQGRIAIVVPVQ
ncbi:MAG: hypothetical protein ACRDQZ_12390 [Mycobacteriales bacterium]